MLSIGYISVCFVVVDHAGRSRLIWVLEAWLVVSLLPISTEFQSVSQLLIGWLSDTGWLDMDQLNKVKATCGVYLLPDFTRHFYSRSMVLEFF